MSPARTLFLVPAGLVLIAGLAGPALHAGGPVPAPLPSEKDRWSRVDTAHFTLFGNASVRRITDLGTRLERFRTMVGKLNKGFSADLHVPITIFVFDTDADYLPYKLRVGGKPGGHVGYFLPRADAVYVTMLGHTDGDPLDIIYHEFTHAVLKANFPSVPVWFGEGLAECYSTFRAADDDQAEIGRPVPEHVATLRSRSAMSLPDLFRVSHDSPDYNETDRSGLFYAQSWALVHYLVWGAKDRQGQLGSFLTGLHEGRTMEASFAGAFKADFATLSGELNRYVRGNRFPFTAVTYKDLDVDRSSTPATAPRDEVLYRLGELLLAIGEERHDDARRHYEEAIRLNARHARAHAGLAVVLEAQGRREEASRLFEKAALLDPADDRVALRFARSLIAGADTEDSATISESDSPPAAIARARALLEPVVARLPGLVEPQVQLGRSYIRHPGDVRRGIVALETALAMAPARVDIMTGLVTLYLRADDRLKAGTFVERVIANTGHPRSLEWARAALNRYDAWQATVQALSSAAATRPEDGSIESDGTAAAVDSGGDGDRPVSSGPPATVAEAEALRVAAARRRQESIAEFEAMLARATDPESVRQFRERIEELRTGYFTEDYNYHVAVYNHAVALANRRKSDEAIALLEKAVPEIKHDDLARMTHDLIARLKKDTARRVAEKPGLRP